MAGVFGIAALPPAPIAIRSLAHHRSRVCIKVKRAFRVITYGDAMRHIPPAGGAAASARATTGEGAAPPPRSDSPARNVTVMVLANKSDVEEEAEVSETDIKNFE